MKNKKAQYRGLEQYTAHTYETETYDGISVQRGPLILDFV